MASTYSPNLRLELIGTGEQQGTWGSTTNTNLGTLLEEAIGGYVSVTVSDVADTTLTTNNGSADQSRNMVINLTGALTGTRNVICPAIEKLYVVRNATTGGQSIVFKVSGQTGITVPNGAVEFLYVDGTDARTITGSIASQDSNNVSITGGSISGTTISGGSVSNASLSNVVVVANASSLGVRDSDGSHVLSIAAGSNLTANRVFTVTTGDAARTLDISASNVTISTAGANLIDDADASAQRTTLGLGTIATQNANNVSVTGGSITGITDIALADGGTGASLSDPNANAILGWNDTANVVRFFTAGSGIEINATSNTIIATGGTPPAANTQTFNSSNTWSKPVGNYTTYKVEVWGAGGSGGRGTTSVAAAGGGGGGYFSFVGSISDLGNSETVTIGLGGASRTTETSGATGGSSSFTRTNSTTITVYGGGGGNSNSTQPSGGGGGGSVVGAGSTGGSTTGGAAGGGDAGAGGTGVSTSGALGNAGSTGGGGGGAAASDATSLNGAGGSSIYGGGGGGAGAEDASPGPGAGGISIFGGNGGAGANDANNATAGSQPGGGGGGSETGNSGAGGNGRIVVTVW